MEMKSEEIEQLIRQGQNDKLGDVLKRHPQVANEKTAQGISLLMYAVYCRNKAAIELLLTLQSDVSLYESAALGDLKRVSQIIDSQPRLINSFSPDGFTALGLACFFGKENCASYLIDHGADANIPSSNPFKVAPIHSSCAISNFEITELLIRHGADVNVCQVGNVTPLHETAHNGQTKLSELLITHKAAVNALTTEGRTPLFMALEKGHTETAELIKSHGGN